MKSVDGADHGTDPVTIRVTQKLADLIPLVPDYPSIFKVHHQLREVNEMAYEPVLLAIGPYHRHKERLAPMEQQKLHYLQSMLGRNKSNVETYIMAMRKLEKTARKYYAESVTLTADEFVEMMLLDGCFIIELFRKYAMPYVRYQGDPIFQISWMLGVLRHDLLLFENQLPFFVLAILFKMSEVWAPLYGIDKLALYFFNATIPYSLYLLQKPRTISYFQHLLSLVHSNVCPSPSSVETEKDLIKEEEEYTDFISMSSATKLQKDGVRFRKLARTMNLFDTKKLEGGWDVYCKGGPGMRFEKLEGDSLFDMKFNNGLLEISQLEIDDDTESFLRNLIAYEQYSGRRDRMYVTDYVTFMNSLINSPKDVELLRQREIIVNRVGGDDDGISTLFNKLCECVVAPRIVYKEICRDVGEHCREHRNLCTPI
ncbi:hypothetical protein CJ030_MR2G007770 [Morella rubra]|uniref:Uncharacterized protein n=1 Tax=Morella rubra TaxID=262757 RepID=A0A6A1WKI7_9ROSI|nr:hypothetical protein CJ030_MR2G007770 [Morella rubra]